MGKYPLTQSEQVRFDKMWKGISTSQKATIVTDFEHFCSWLRGEDSSFYYAIKNKLHDLWEDIKSTIGDFVEGFAEGLLLPVIGVVEGVKAIGKLFED